jgi:hypothetical protein
MTMEQLQADNEVLRASLAQARAERECARNVLAQADGWVDSMHQICFASGIPCGNIVGRVRDMATTLEQTRQERDGLLTKLEGVMG